MRGRESTLHQSVLPFSKKVHMFPSELADPIGLSEEDLDLVELVKAGLITEGDVLAYRRHFRSLSTTVEKDMLVCFPLRMLFFRSSN